jgi:hypothetical protein
MLKKTLLPLLVCRLALPAQQYNRIYMRPAFSAQSLCNSEGNGMQEKSVSTINRTSCSYKKGRVR